MARGAAERAQIAQKLQAEGLHYFTRSQTKAPLSGPPRAQLLLTRDERGTARIMTRSGTYTQLLQDSERLPSVQCARSKVDDGRAVTPAVTPA